MKLFKRKNIIPLCLASLFAAFAASVTADRIVTVYGQGAVLGTFSAAEVDSIAFGTTGTLFKLYNSSRYQLLLRSRSKVDSIVFSGEYDKSSYPEFNTTSLYHDMNVSYNEDSKVYSLSTTGGDPYIFTKTLTADLPSDSCVIAFESRVQSIPARRLSQRCQRPSGVFRRPCKRIQFGKNFADSGYNRLGMGYFQIQHQELPRTFRLG